MSVTSYKFPGTAENADRNGKAAWIIPDNAKTDNNVGAQLATSKNQYSDWLRLTNFGFTSADIPSGATITGIEVAIKRYASSANQIGDSALYLRNETAQQEGNNKASAAKYPIAWETVYYGADGDMWGTGLTQPDILDSDFGIDLSCVQGSPGANALVDYIKIRVYYTEAPSTAPYRALKGLISGYHCFMKQYIDFTKLGLAPLKLPDGTLW